MKKLSILLLALQSKVDMANFRFTTSSFVFKNENKGPNWAKLKTKNIILLCSNSYFKIFNLYFFFLFGFLL